MVMVLWLPMVAMNAFMFISGHELYKDSPATILIVLSYAIVFAMPATTLCVLYLVHRKNIWRLIRYGKEEAA
jgi:hypothetical protein